MELAGIGPGKNLTFSPADRLTVITGDNGLGKTFILDCAWWSLTGSWAGNQASPRPDAGRSEPSITFEIAGRSGFSQKKTVKYDWESHSWPPPKKRPTVPGLIVYARVDGSFAVWDPVRHSRFQPVLGDWSSSEPLLFSRDDVLKGLDGKIEGLLRDWVKWQLSPNEAAFATFRRVLQRLSPPDMKPLQPGAPIRLPKESRDIPTLSHPYGDVPIINESAGVRRIVTIAYLLVWTWEEHKTFSALAKKAPQERMVVLVDEMEAHLHPKWQRVVLPALLDVADILGCRTQTIVTTHSPLVLASMETDFREETDKLFHLQLKSGTEVRFGETPFLRRGRVDAWLTSDLFELKQARSREGERAIERANAILSRKSPSPEEIREVSEELARTVASDDDFWPRWVYFAESKGVRL